MLLETSMYARSDDALELDEWIEVIEACEALDAPRLPASHDYYFIICQDQTVMIEKQYWSLVVSDL